MENINHYFREMGKSNIVFKNRHNFEDFLFEYACQALDYHKQKKSTKNINTLIVNKMSNLYTFLDVYKKEFKSKKIRVLTPPSKLIKAIIKYEEENSMDGLVYYVNISLNR